MRNELLKWAEEESSNATLASKTHNNQFYVGQASAFQQIIDKINSIPVPSVEGYLENIAKMSDDGKIWWLLEDDALAALQSLACDKDEEISNLVDRYVEKDKENVVLQAEVERFRWIPVEERLPELGKAVLVYNPKEDKDYFIYTVDYTFIGTDKKTYWDFHGSDVTHWMPLPEPPKQ